jgi:hypothetical protein
MNLQLQAYKPKPVRRKGIKIASIFADQPSFLAESKAKIDNDSTVFYTPEKTLKVLSCTLVKFLLADNELIFCTLKNPNALTKDHEWVKQNELLPIIKKITKTNTIEEFICFMNENYTFWQTKPVYFLRVKPLFTPSV